MLCVDDEPALLRALARLFVSHGYRVLTASSGAEALALARQHVPDVLFTDVNMSGMNGCELISEFQQLYPTTARIATTVLPDRETIVTLLRSGAHDVVLRPYISLNQLLERVELNLARMRAVSLPFGQRRRPRVFVGSSREGLLFARAIQQELAAVAEVTVWSQGAFGMMDYTLESLYEQLDIQDFAVLVLTPDDLLRTRGRTSSAPRDNVLLELGMFLGRLGRDRTFVVVDKMQKIKLPTDLAGVSLGEFEQNSTGNLRAAVGPVCTAIASQILELGIRLRLSGE